MSANMSVFAKYTRRPLSKVIKSINTLKYKYTYTLWQSIIQKQLTLQYQVPLCFSTLLLSMFSYVRLSEIHIRYLPSVHPLATCICKVFNPWGAVVSLFISDLLGDKLVSPVFLLFRATLVIPQEFLWNNHCWLWATGGNSKKINYVSK